MTGGGNQSRLVLNRAEKMGLRDSGDASSDLSERAPLKSVTEIIKKRKRKIDRKRHACTHEGCSYVFSRPYRLAAHLKVHEGHRPFTCEFKDCTKAYSNKSHLTRHIKTAHDEQKSTPEANICCPQCDDLFTNRQNLKRHIYRKHERDFPFRCESCQIGFLKKNLLDAHMYLHTGIKAFKCDFCEETFRNRTDCYNHKKHHKIYKCFCGKVFTRWLEIAKHRKDEHEFHVFQCDDCDKVFKMRAHIARHMKIHHLPGVLDVFVCPFEQCLKYYPYKSNLSFHIKSIHEEKTFDCTVPGCNAKLSTMSVLQRHTAKHNQTVIVPKSRKTPAKHIDKRAIERSHIRLESETVKRSDVPADVTSVSEKLITTPDDSESTVFLNNSDVDSYQTANDPTISNFSDHNK